MKQHWLAIILTVIVGLIVGWPHMVIPRLIAPERYDPLQFVDGVGSSITMEEVYTYVPEVREILEGKFWVTDTQIAEYNGRPTPFTGETGLAWLMAGLTKLTGSMERAFMAADFVFPAMTFLLVYAIMLVGLPRRFAPRNDGRNDGRIIAAAAGAVVVLWPELAALIPYPDKIIAGFTAAFNPRDFLLISRNFHPQLSLPAYLLAFLLVLKVTVKGGSFKEYPLRIILLPVAAGLSVGFLFYSYIFNWTTFSMGFILFFLIRSLLAVRQGDSLKYKTRNLLIIFAVAGITAAPYFLQIWQFRQSGLAEDFFLKLSLPKRSFFDLTARHWIFILLFLIANARFFDFARDDGRSGRSLRMTGFLCFWAATLILPDLGQMIFGRDLEGKHWVRRIGYPMSIMGLGLLIGEIREIWEIRGIRGMAKKLIDTAAALVLIGVMVYGVLVQVNMSKKAALAYAVDDEKQKLYDYINSNLPSGAVVLSLDWENIVNIPAKTQAFNFSPIGMRTIATTEETLERFLWSGAIYGKSEDWVWQAFSDNGIGTTRVYYFAYADKNQVFNLPEETREDAVLRYLEIQKRFDADEKPPYKLDYVLAVSEVGSVLQSVE